MTPAELNKSLTVLLNEQLADTGFKKKRIGRLTRKTKECEQALSFYFTRDRGLPGNLYSLSCTLSFSFPEVDKLTSEFLGEKYDARWGTGAEPLYMVVPDKPISKYKYCSDAPLSRFAEMVSEDFHSYALSFYERYDTLNKLEQHFDRTQKGITGAYDFHVVLSGRQPGNGHGCCAAAVLCTLEKWDKLCLFLKETELISEEQRKRIGEHIPTDSPNSF